MLLHFFWCDFILTKALSVNYYNFYFKAKECKRTWLGSHN